MKNQLYILVLLLQSMIAFGQLDSIHYMPPMHARVDWGPQTMILTTPETVAFPVQIKDGSGNLIQTVNISNTQPYKYEVGSSDDTYLFVTAADLHLPLSRKGLIVEAKKKFYAYVRIIANSRNQASDLTCKGRAALGTTFRIGHLLQNTGNSLSNFIGILAVEDSTLIKLSNFDPNVKFRRNSGDVTSVGTEVIMLQKGESLVFSNYLNTNASSQPPNGLMGALLEASKPVAVNTGSWCGSPVNTGDKDTGIDQIASLENVGREYILCKGNGNSTLERPILIAHFDDTEVFINGSVTGIVLDAGEYFAVPTSSFTSENNMHIRSTKKIFVYQMIGGIPSGSNQFRTEGLIFVPPISCSIPSTIDNITEPNVIGGTYFTGGVMITAMKDSVVNVYVNGALVNLGAAAKVTGNPDFVTYRKLDLFSENAATKTISVLAKGAVQVAMYGQNDAASFASFYSGFSKSREPNISLKRIGDGVCPDTLIASGLYDGVQWMYADSIIKFGADSFLVVNAPGDYIALGYLGVCRQNETASDTINVDFESPEFLYTLKEPSCFGFSDGEIKIINPMGGYPPYQYSINKGFDFGKQPTFTGLATGTYKLVVRDSVGCYNRPLQVFIDQPTEFSVEIVKKSHFKTDIIPLGQVVKLQGIPERGITKAVWNPSDSVNCKDCLINRVRPLLTTNIVTLAVTDSMGCVAIDTIILYVEPTVYIPNVFNPLSEYKNTHFILYTKDPLPIKKLIIYDRWGNQLFATQNINTNELMNGWDGRVNGQLVNPAVFVYYAEVEVLPGVLQVFKGDISVVH